MKKIIMILMFSMVSVFAFEKLTLDTFEEKLKGKNAIVDFYADWCGPCKILDKNLKTFNDIKPDGVTVYKLDIDNDGMLAQKYNINRIPALLYFKDGKHIKTTLGVKSAKQIEATTKETFNLK